MKTRSFKVHLLIAVAMMAFGAALIISTILLNLSGEWVLWISGGICIFSGVGFQKENIRLEKGSRYSAKTDNGEHIVVEEVN